MSAEAAAARVQRSLPPVRAHDPDRRAPDRRDGAAGDSGQFASPARSPARRRPRPRCRSGVAPAAAVPVPAAAAAASRAAAHPGAGRGPRWLAGGARGRCDCCRGRRCGDGGRRRLRPAHRLATPRPRVHPLYSPASPRNPRPPPARPRFRALPRTQRATAAASSADTKASPTQARPRRPPRPVPPGSPSRALGRHPTSAPGIQRAGRRSAPRRQRRWARPLASAGVRARQRLQRPRHVPPRRRLRRLRVAPRPPRRSPPRRRPWTTSWMIRRRAGARHRPMAGATAACRPMRRAASRGGRSPARAAMIGGLAAVIVGAILVVAGGHARSKAADRGQAPRARRPRAVQSTSSERAGDTPQRIPRRRSPSGHASPCSTARRHGTGASPVGRVCSRAATRRRPAAGRNARRAAIRRRSSSTPRASRDAAQVARRSACRSVVPMEGAVAALAGGAPVVVIAGLDRATDAESSSGGATSQSGETSSSGESAGGGSAP